MFDVSGENVIRIRFGSLLAANVLGILPRSTGETRVRASSNTPTTGFVGGPALVLRSDHQRISRRSLKTITSQLPEA